MHDEKHIAQAMHVARILLAAEVEAIAAAPLRRVCIAQVFERATQRGPQRREAWDSVIGSMVELDQHVGIRFAK